MPDPHVGVDVLGRVVEEPEKAVLRLLDAVALVVGVNDLSKEVHLLNCFAVSGPPQIMKHNQRGGGQPLQYVKAQMVGKTVSLVLQMEVQILGCRGVDS